MRALEPRVTGYTTNPADGVRIYYEVFGPEQATRTIVFMQTWHIIHSRMWKYQTPYFARNGFRVVVYDPRGNGKSDRPDAGYDNERMVEDCVLVCRDIGVGRATFVGLSHGVQLACLLAAQHPDMVERLVLIGGGGTAVESGIHRAARRLNERPPDREGWNKFNTNHMREDYSDFVSWFLRMCISEPHSTKGVEDTIRWAHETNGEVLVSGLTSRRQPSVEDLARSIECPVLIINGSGDRIFHIENAYARCALFPDASLVVVGQGGHNTSTRDPVRFNELVHDFIGRDFTRAITWPRALTRPKRALFVSSPIGLGHVRRDIEIARELRKIAPDLHIDWLAQPPVSTVLEESGERVHPLSADLAAEAEHIDEAAARNHELDIFEAIRDMDEILLANFFVFLDAVRETPYDVWICDEAWEVDRFLFENPELKTAPYVWLTDVTGYLPAGEESASERERILTADYNAELINQIDRYPALRDRSLFIGDPDDLQSVSMGPGLPTIDEWTRQTHDFTGYVRYFDPEALPTQSASRSKLGLDPNERIALASAGGTTAGEGLLRWIVDVWPAVRERFPDLALHVVAGPRIETSDFPDIPGVTYRGYAPNLHELLGAVDVALVQGGLATTMELVALGKPFLYFPLQKHYEQQRHVAFRLERYGVPDWARIQFPEATPELLVDRLQRVFEEKIAYSPVDASGARRAAEQIASLIGRAPSYTVPGVDEDVWIRTGDAR